MPEGRYDALSLVMRAIARASAERDEKFAEALGTQLRSVLCATDAGQEVFHEVFAWLAAFEAATARPAGDRRQHASS